MFTSLRLSLRLGLLLLSICGNVLLMPVIENNFERLRFGVALLEDGGLLLFRIGQVGSLGDLVCSL